MIDRIDPKARSDAYGRRINREHSPVLAYAIPPLSIIFASILPTLFVASAAPLLPPLGFLALMAWRIVRPGLLPIWAGFPLGAVNDLFSGQPFGSAILLWSLAMMGYEIIDSRFPLRSFGQEWFNLTVAAVIYLFSAALFSGATLTLPMLTSILPQLLLSALLIPIIARMVARLDKLRLLRIRTVG